MERTNKKECPKCKSKNIVETGNKANDGGDMKSNGGYQIPYHLIYKCEGCGEIFIFEEG